MSDRATAIPLNPARQKGSPHVFAAASSCVGGARRLWGQVAVRHLWLMLPVWLILLAVIETTLVDYALMEILFFCLFAVKALNTAIECLFDHLTPQCEQFACDAGDSGSRGPMHMLFAIGVFLAAIVLSAILQN